MKFPQDFAMLSWFSADLRETRHVSQDSLTQEVQQQTNRLSLSLSLHSTEAAPLTCVRDVTAITLQSSLSSASAMLGGMASGYRCQACGQKAGADLVEQPHALDPCSLGYPVTRRCSGQRHCWALWTVPAWCSCCLAALPKICNACFLPESD